MTTRLLVGDVFARMAELPDHSFDLIVTSPPFLALRSYLPDDHPDKALEIGSEATPADYLDTLLALSAEWRRLLAPHGSIAVELGDTYAGSGGAGGDYDEDGLRDGQQKFRGSGRLARYSDDRGNPAGMRDPTFSGANTRNGSGSGWPLPKSLTGIPTLYAWSLAYGRNLLTGEPSPAGRWRIRNLKPWIRSNPPVGALGDKERPATSYVTVACVSSARWFDLDAVRTANPRVDEDPGGYRMVAGKPTHDAGPRSQNAGGAPPLDWWHPVDAVIDAVIDQRTAVAGRSNGGKSHGSPKGGISNGMDPVGRTLQPARGVHIRRALTDAGLLPTGDFYDVSRRGYAGAHYAVWPPELVRLLVDEMCPRQVCTQCGEPSWRIVETKRRTEADDRHRVKNAAGERPGPGCQDRAPEVGWQMERRTLGWSNCECCSHPQTTYNEQDGTLYCERCHSWVIERKWRPGRILDPFSGSGTTLAVANDMSRDAVGIDIDQASYGMTIGRMGPLVAAVDFTIDWPTPNWELATLPRADGDYTPWVHMLGEAGQLAAEETTETDGPWWLDPEWRNQLAVRYERRNGRRPVVDVPGQGGLFTEEATA